MHSWNTPFNFNYYCCDRIWFECKRQDGSWCCLSAFWRHLLHPALIYQLVSCRKSNLDVYISVSALCCIACRSVKCEVTLWTVYFCEEHWETGHWITVWFNYCITVWFTLCHGYMWHKIISTTDRVVKIFQNYFSDTERVEKYSWTAIWLFPVSQMYGLAIQLVCIQIVSTTVVLFALYLQWFYYVYFCILLVERHW